MGKVCIVNGWGNSQGSAANLHELVCQRSPIGQDEERPINIKNNILTIEDDFQQEFRIDPSEGTAMSPVNLAQSTSAQGSNQESLADEDDNWFDYEPHIKI